ncbi:MAG: response regulator [Pseudomonadales bacterium]|nr:response regulator [Pseudomonadales bacterium]
MTTGPANAVIPPYVPRILFVDDEKAILDSLRRTCRGSGWSVATANSGAEGLALLGREEFDLVVSDMRMPQMDGAAFLSEVAATFPSTRRILLTGYSDIESTIRAVNDGGIDCYISKPWDNDDLKKKINDVLYTRRLEAERAALISLTEQQNAELKKLNEELEATVNKRTSQVRTMLRMVEKTNEGLQDSQRATVEVFSRLIDMYEGGNAGHGKRVADLGLEIARRMGLKEQELQQIYYAALLHDVGKIGMPREIVDVPFAKLSRIQLKTYREHPALGEALLLSIPSLRVAANIIYCHHEYLNGTGYPRKLTGNSIPLGARILTPITDFDDLVEGRMQEAALAPEKAEKYLLDNINKLYEKEVVDHLIALRAELGDMTSFDHERMITSKDLRKGMRLARDLLSPSGVPLLSKEHVFDDMAVRKIQMLELDREKSFPIYVYQEMEFLEE